MELTDIIDKELLERAAADKVLISQIAVDFAKSYFTVYRWLNWDYKNLPPAAYKSIEKYFKHK